MKNPQGIAKRTRSDHVLLDLERKPTAPGYGPKGYPHRRGISMIMSSVDLRLRIERNERGDVRSSLEFTTPEDEESARSWPSGGLVQLSHAIFVEALKRESYTMAISILSTGAEIEDISNSPRGAGMKFPEDNENEPIAIGTISATHTPCSFGITGLTVNFIQIGSSKK